MALNANSSLGCERLLAEDGTTARGSASETLIAMTIDIVRTSDRPDLARITGMWRWEAFYRGGTTDSSEVLARDAGAASSSDLLPTVLVLLEDDQPIGMIAICLDDLDGRPELNLGWLACTSSPCIGVGGTLCGL